jgi:hypothetical protein
LTVITAAAILLVTAAGGAQPGPAVPPAPPLDAPIREKIIQGIIKELNEGYVYPETARRIEAELQEKQEAGQYDQITDPTRFAETLTADLRAIAGDKHLRVIYDPDLPRGGPREGAKPARPQQDFLRSINYGFERVERLEGNVGYLELRGFLLAGSAGDTAGAAMGFLANTDALIIDLRRNGGGDPNMVALLCSYLFDAKPVHLNDLYFRPDNSTRQFWTLPHVPGSRYVGKGVYLLTSQRTFSAAEEFAYNLKTLGRVTIIGETTGGGAHPGGLRRIDDHFAINVPTGRAINPITKTNWEGVGVRPDVDVPAELALKTAHLAALEKIMANQPGGNQDEAAARRTGQIPALIEKIRKELDELRSTPQDRRPPRGSG